MSWKGRKNLVNDPEDVELFQTRVGKLTRIGSVLLLRLPLWTLAAVLFGGGLVARIICRHHSSLNSRIDMGREAMVQVPFYGLGLLVLFAQFNSPERTDAGSWWLLGRTLEWLAWFLAVFVSLIAILDSMPP